MALGSGIVPGGIIASDGSILGQGAGSKSWVGSPGRSPVIQSTGITTRQKLLGMQDGNSHDGRHGARTVNATSFCILSAVIGAAVPAQVAF